MEQSPLISEMDQIHFGSKVFCTDGEEGTLTHLGIDSATQRVISLAVKIGRFWGKTVYLPFSTVNDANADGVYLTITREELAASQESATTTMVDAHTPVQETHSGARGSLMLVAVQPSSGEIAYVVAHDLRDGQDILVQKIYINQIDTSAISTTIPDATWQTLPPYRSDLVLQREVEQIIFDFTPLHIDLPGMKLRVLDSVLYISGNISSSLRGDIVYNQASGVPGLLEIKNQLYGDDTLAGELAMELGRDPRTRDLPIGVYPRLGEVRLSGPVHSDQQRDAAEEIVKSHAGVRSVINDLIVNPEASILNVMASATPGTAADLIPGKYIRHTK